MIKSQSFRAVQTYKLISALYLLLFFAAFYIVSNSAKFGLACGFGLYCAVMYYYKKNPALPLLSYAFALAAADFSLYALYSTGISALIFFLCAYILNISKKSTPLRLCLIVLISRVTIFLNGGGAGVIASFVIDIFFSALFFLICVNAFKAPLFRGLKNKIATDEIVCMAMLVLAFYAVLYGINFFGFKIYSAVAVFTILVSLFVYNIGFALSYSLIIGAAVCLLSNSAAHLGVFALYALTASVFKDTSKYIAAVSVILLDLLFAYYFKIYGNTYTYIDIIPLFVGAAAFLLVPKHFLKNLTPSANQRLLSRHIINRIRGQLNLKLVNISEVFYEMEKIFCGMIKGYMSPEDAQNILAADAKEEVCSSCPQKNICHKENADIVEKGFALAIRAGIDKGKVTLLDIPPKLASVCTRANSFLSVCGRLSGSYRQYALVVSNLDTSRALIGRQFKGVGDILSQLARETKYSVGFDTNTEKTIIDELAYNNIVCSEAIVYNENNSDMHISLLLKARDSYDKRISKIISNLCRRRMVVSKREESIIPDFSVLQLKPAPRYDVIFGAAGCAKEGRSISGDTHSLTRISEDKFLIVLCDGMGSGEDAQKTSSMAISMVENFYRAGFDSPAILSAVNRLLNVGGEDNFAALDICAVSLSDGVCDFIKLGCPQGYIKKKTETEVIESNALPVGILDELAPTVTTKKVGNGDIIVLVSDGVAEAFKEEDGLKEFIFAETSANPQQIAENILTKALSGNPPKDDMTVLTMRIYIQI